MIKCCLHTPQQMVLNKNMLVRQMAHLIRHLQTLFTSYDKLQPSMEIAKNICASWARKAAGMSQKGNTS